MKVSVALCTYNGENYLRTQLQSIFDQSVSVDEIVICDDRSKDGTTKIITEFENKYPGIIRLYVNQSNLGSKHNFEKAISLTNGDYIFLSDQDDIWLPSKVEWLINEFANNKNVLMIFTNGDLIDEQGKEIGSTLWDKWGYNVDLRNKWRNNENAYNDLLVNYNKVTGATVAIRKELKKHILPFKLQEGFWHDAWMASQAARYNGLYFLEESLIKYRIHAQQLVGIGNGTIFRNDLPGDFYLRQKRRVANFINKFRSLLK